MKTLIEWTKSGFPLVIEKEAERRAHICLNCPKRSQMASHALEQKAYDALVYIFRRVKKTALKSQHLGQCSVCGCALDVKVWMDGPLNLDNLTFPDWCWINPPTT